MGFLAAAATWVFVAGTGLRGLPLSCPSFFVQLGSMVCTPRALTSLESCSTGDGPTPPVRHKVVQEVAWPEQGPVLLAHLGQWPSAWLRLGFSGSLLALDQRGSA